MTDRRPSTLEDRITDWSTSPPTIIKGGARSLDEIDPAELPDFQRPIVIRKRRAAGLADYPEGSRGAVSEPSREHGP